MEGLDTVGAMLAMVAGAVPRLGVDAGRCAAAVTGDLLATDEVYRRVRAGVPFRSAYRELAAELAGGARVPALSPDEVLDARTHLGGAGAPAIGELAAVAANAREGIDERRRRFTDALAALVGKAAP
jgi:argininosuccinate lyase